jgi:Mg2+-importing ATPase
MPLLPTAVLPFPQSRASWPLLAMSAAVMLLGMWLPASPIGHWLGFTPLPHAYWPLLGLTLGCYAVLTHLVKTWLLRRGWV